MKMTELKCTDGELPEDPDEYDRRLKVLLKYINESISANATDDNTRKLDNIVRSTKSKKDVGVRYMKSWEGERELREEGREEERAQTEREQARADRAESELRAAKERIAELEALLEAKQKERK